MPDLINFPTGDSEWIVLHARPRCEKRILEVCQQQGAVGYLPVRRKTHKYGGRVREFTSPLFSGYAFALVDPRQKAFLRQNRNVANILDVVDQETLVRQLQQIRVALESGNDIEVLPYLEIGRIVRLAHGPLRGLEGRVTRIKGRSRIVVNVDMIRESVAVEIDLSWLDPAS